MTREPTDPRDALSAYLAWYGRHAPARDDDVVTRGSATAQPITIGDLRRAVEEIDRLRAEVRRLRELGLDEMVAEAQRLGLYDDDGDAGDGGHRER